MLTSDLVIHRHATLTSGQMDIGPRIDGGNDNHIIGKGLKRNVSCS